MKFISKINSLFSFRKEKDAEGAEVWLVSWNARYGEYSGEKQRVAKAFLLEEDAIAFAESLKQAHKLLQNTNDIHIEITRQD